MVLQPLTRDWRTRYAEARADGRIPTETAEEAQARLARAERRLDYLRDPRMEDR